MFINYVEDESAPLLFSKTRGIRGKFEMVNTNVTMANTLRRAILTLTPSVGFRTEPYERSNVVITTNTTPLVNEMIAHRIGMIPIHANPVGFDPDLYEFVIDKINDDKVNDKKEIIDVCAADFKVYKKNPDNLLEAPVLVPTEDFFPPDPITGETVLITRLRPQWNPSAPKEHLVLKAKASISTGAENIRWSPVSQASYEYTRDTDPAHLDAVFGEWLAKTKKITDSSAVTEELKREFETMEIQRCYLTDAKGNPNHFTFHLESIGVQPIPDIVRSAIAACESLVRKYQDMDGTVPENVRIQQGDTRYPSIDIVFTNEGHTLGNLLETVIVERNVDGGDSPKVNYVGYKVPHPLRPEMFVRIALEDTITDPEIQKNMARLAIANACKYLIETFRSMQSSWTSLHAPTGGVSETKEMT